MRAAPFGFLAIETQNVGVKQIRAFRGFLDVFRANYFSTGAFSKFRRWLKFFRRCDAQFKSHLRRRPNP